MSMDDGYRKMVSKLGQRTDKVEPQWDAENEIIAYPAPEADGWVTAYHTIAKGVADTVVTKQAAYGDSHGKSGAILAILYPHGILPEQMSDALTVTRIIDKLFRIATDRDALGESPWHDVAGYALLALKRGEK